MKPKAHTVTKIEEVEVPEIVDAPIAEVEVNGTVKDMSLGYVESNRKTEAFYVTMAAMIVLFLGSHFWGDSKPIIEAIGQLAVVYIGGLAATDSMRYYKFGSNTLGNPEKQKELENRYKDK